MTRRNRSLLPFVCAAFGAAACIVIAGSAAATAADPPPDVLLGEFDSDVPETVLDCPDPASPFATTVAGPDILGGELDLALDCVGTGPADGPTAMSLTAAGLRAETTGSVPAMVRMIWDGVGGSPDVDPEGLGGIDLTAGGTKDSFVFDFTEVGASNPMDPVPAGAVVEVFVYTDGDNYAHQWFPIAASGLVRIPLTYVQMGPQTGTGADVTNVGAIAVTFADLPSTGASTIGSLQTGTMAQAAMTDAVVGGGTPAPGDTVEYTVTVENPTNAAAYAVDDATFEWTPEADGGTLVPGSVTSTQGSVTIGAAPGDPTVSVSLGALPSGASATIQFRVMIDQYGDLSNQGRLTYTVAPDPDSPETNALTTSTETDDPDTAAYSDATATAVPAPPVVANDDAVETTFEVPATGNVLTNDTGPIGGLVASLVTAPVSGTVVLNADGSFTYTPNTGFHGIDSLTYQTTSATTAATDQGTLTITVGDPVVANPDSYATPFGAPVAGNVLDNDTGPGTLAATLVTPPDSGTVVLDPNGTFAYTPLDGFSGTATFTYEAESLDTGLTDEATVTITVDPAVPVVATPDTFATTFGAPVTGNVLANDSGPAGALTAEVVDEPANGTLVLDPDGTFTYTPDSGFSGTDGFTYRAVGGATGVPGPTGPSGLAALALPGDIGTVSIVVAAAPDTTPAPTAPPTTSGTVPPPPTTDPLAPTIPGELPATGSDSSGLAVMALVVLGLGTALTVGVRRRRHA